MYITLFITLAILIPVILLYEWRLWVHTKSDIKEYMSFAKKGVENKKQTMKKVLKEITRAQNIAHRAKIYLISRKAKKWFLLNIFLQYLVASFAILALREDLKLEIKILLATLCVIFFIVSCLSLGAIVKKYESRKKKPVLLRLAKDNFAMIFICFIVIFGSVIVTILILTLIEFLISGSLIKVFIGQTLFLSQRYDLFSQISFTVAIGFLIILSLSHFKEISKKYELSLDSAEKELHKIITTSTSDELTFLVRIFDHELIMTKAKEFEKISDYFGLTYSLRWLPFIYTVFGIIFFLLPALPYSSAPNSMAFFIPDILILVALCLALVKDMLNVAKIYGKMMIET